MTTGKDAVRQLVLTDAQQALDHYGVGVQLRLLSLERIAPPQEVAAAFNDVQSARQDRDRLVNEATGYANELAPQARGQAAELLRQAEAYRTRVINEATGQAARFVKLAAAYRAAPAVTRVRMRLELLEKVAPNLRTTIVDSDQGRRPIDLGVIGLGVKPPASSGATP
ncbi:MAG: hypothetical protein HXY24_14655 [Rubrivivax sp.]|nr:hypothetical protein [Rubrivivax sp.]